MSKETKKKRRYYKVNEKVWALPLKKVGVVKDIDTSTYDVLVDVKGTVHKFKLWEINKLRKQNKRNYKKRNNKPLEIEIRYIDKEISPVEQTEKGNWIDLRAAEDVELKAGESALVPLGVAMVLPKGYEAYILPRSSSFKSFGFVQTNGMGVIDETYKGNNDQWFLSILAIRDVTIKKNDRICQFRLQKAMPKVVFKVVESFDNPDRGGFGSTGMN